MSIVGMCKHGAGGQSPCKAGVSLIDFPLGKRPCHGHKEGVKLCDKFVAYTQEDLDRIIEEGNHHSDCIKRNVSPCCEAPIDKSHVIQEGRYKGHGTRYCSKCGKMVYQV